MIKGFSLWRPALVHFAARRPGFKSNIVRESRNLLSPMFAWKQARFSNGKHSYLSTVCVTQDLREYALVYMINCRYTVITYLPYISQWLMESEVGQRYEEAYALRMLTRSPVNLAGQNKSQFHFNRYIEWSLAISELGWILNGSNSVPAKLSDTLALQKCKPNINKIVTLSMPRYVLVVARIGTSSKCY